MNKLCAVAVGVALIVSPLIASAFETIVPPAPAAKIATIEDKEFAEQQAAEEQRKEGIALISKALEQCGTIDSKKKAEFCDNTSRAAMAIAMSSGSESRDKANIVAAAYGAGRSNTGRHVRDVLLGLFGAVKTGFIVDRIAGAAKEGFRQAGDDYTVGGDFNSGDGNNYKYPRPDGIITGPDETVTFPPSD